MEVRSVVSSPVFLENIREDWKKWCGTGLALCVILALLFLSCVPTGESLLLGLEEYFLDPALQLVSLKLTDPSVSGTLATVFFGFWALLLPAVYTFSRAEALVAEGMESGRLITYIATPLGREKVIRTEAFSLVFGQFSMVAAFMGAGLFLGEFLCPGELEIPDFLFRCVGAFAVQFVLGGFGFLVSCSGVGKKLRRLLLWGLTGLGFLLYLVGNLGGILEIPGNLTVFSVLRPDRFQKGDGSLTAAFLVLVGIIFYSLAFLVFQKRDLKFGRKGIS